MNRGKTVSAGSAPLTVETALQQAIDRAVAVRCRMKLGS